MDYAEKLTTSFSKFWNNRSLLSVMLLEFILAVLLGILFFLGDMVVLSYMNKDALAVMPVIDWHVFLNAPTIITAIVLIAIQLLIFIYIDSFFKAGFYGMLKNVVQDGSTAFAEFLPNAKRYWRSMFRFLLLRNAIILVFLAPLVIALISYLGTTQQFVTMQQQVFVVVAFLLLVLAMIAVFYWFFYGEAVIVFEDANVAEAMRTSTQMANRSVGVTIASLVTVGVIIILGSAVESVLMVPFQLLAASSQVWVIVAGFVRFLLNIITISAGIVASLFICFTYDELTMKKAARKVQVKRAIVPIKRKK